MDLNLADLPLLKDEVRYLLRVYTEGEIITHIVSIEVITNSSNLTLV